jgi:hypothetical protein
VVHDLPCFTPEDQTAAFRGKPSYDGLFYTCKQIRQEAPEEIRRAAERYYRAHEKEWQRTYGHSITVEQIKDPSNVTVVLPHSMFKLDRQLHSSGRLSWDTAYPVSLRSLPLQLLKIKISSPESGSSSLMSEDIFEDLLLSILIDKPKARRIYFHRGELLADASIHFFNGLCWTLNGYHQRLQANRREVQAQHRALLAIQATQSTDMRNWNT